MNVVEKDQILLKVLQIKLEDWDIFSKLKKSSCPSS